MSSVSRESSQYRSVIRVSYRITSFSESQSEPSDGLSYARRGSVRSAKRGRAMHRSEWSDVKEFRSALKSWLWETKKKIPSTRVRLKRWVAILHTSPLLFHNHNFWKEANCKLFQLEVYSFVSTVSYSNLLTNMFILFKL
jgi:hypothetical protein